jgi:hypothetical protein
MNSNLRLMPLIRVADSFDHPDWVFELKHDGFRALAYVEPFALDVEEVVPAVCIRGGVAYPFTARREQVQKPLDADTRTLRGSASTLNR